MNRYIGIDAHDKSCMVVVLNERGVELDHRPLETNGAALVNFIRAIPRPRHVAFEEGNLAQWLYELLEPECEQVVPFIPPTHSGPKDDYRDARRAADALRTHSIERPVYKQRELADLRSAVRAYQIQRKDLTRTKVRLNAVFRSRAVFVGAEIYDAEKRKKELERLSEFDRRLAGILGRQVDAQTQFMEEADKQLRKSAKQEAVRRVATVPGIGYVRAATIVAIVGTPDRFRTREQFRSYCGLGVVRWSTSDWQRQQERWVRVNKDRTRGLNRNRNGWLKDAFKGAAMDIVNRDPDHPLVRKHVARLAKGVAPNLSILTVARQLADTVLAMWKNKNDYDPNWTDRKKEDDQPTKKDENAKPTAV